MKKSDDFICYTYFGLMASFAVMCFLCIIFNTIDDNYKKGQIDAINGKIKYELKKTENGESVWVEKKK